MNDKYHEDHDGHEQHKEVEDDNGHHSNDEENENRKGRKEDVVNPLRGCGLYLYHILGCSFMLEVRAVQICY